MISLNFLTLALIVSILVNVLAFGILLWRNRTPGSSSNPPSTDQLVERNSEKVSTPPTSAANKKLYRIQRIVADEPGILSGLTVMIADDNQVNIDVLSGMLEFFGIERLIVVENGLQAVEAADEHKVDLIYMDIQMPKLNGIEAAKRILAKPEYRELSIIPITGFSRIVNSDMCKDAGMIGFLQKPVDLNELRKTTQIALRQFQMA